MEGYYEGQQGAGLVAFGILNPDKQTSADGVEPFLMRIELPKMLSLLAERDPNAFVPGINNLLEGGYRLKDGSQALSAEEKMARGRKAIAAFAAYRTAKADGNEEAAAEAAVVLQNNVAYFGYGYIKDVNELVPNVPLTFYMFRVMVMLGGYFILFLQCFCFGLPEESGRDALDALDCPVHYSVGLSGRTGRLGSGRMRPSALGHTGHAAYFGCHFEARRGFGADNFLHLLSPLHGIADSRDRHHATSHSQGILNTVVLS